MIKRIPRMVVGVAVLCSVIGLMYFWNTQRIGSQLRDESVVEVRGGAGDERVEASKGEAVMPVAAKSKQAVGEKAVAAVDGGAKDKMPKKGDLGGGDQGGNGGGNGGGVPAAAGGEGQPIRASLREEVAQGRSAAEILAGKDMSDDATRARVVEEMSELDRKQMEAVKDKAKRLGLQMRETTAQGKVREIYDFRGDQPIYRVTHNVNAAISNGSSLLAAAPMSLTGTGETVGIWDGGSVRSTHQEFGGRVQKMNGATPNDDHATHVAGTMSAAGVNNAAKGMATSIQVKSYDWDNDTAEMASIGAATSNAAGKICASNHSYGFNAVTEDMGRYETNARDMDALVYSLPYYQPFWAAGNEQGDLTAKEGFQSITYLGLAKNVLTVGATSDAVANGVRAPEAATITSFSSLGPCDDGRIKPDVVANGLDVTSSVARGDTAYGQMSGTSMATPSVTGTVGLLTQLYRQEFGVTMRNSMIKALLIHTATDMGNPGPDYTYGWGLVNGKAAGDLILENKQAAAVPKMNEGTITSTELVKTYDIVWDGVSPIRATLCWVDPEGVAQSAPDSRTPNLVNNLDLKVIGPDGTTEYMPFVMPFVGNWTVAGMKKDAVTGKNNVDNVEQVLIKQPVAGMYRVQVSLDGRLTKASQVYSLIVTGGLAIETNPPPSVKLTAPAAGEYGLVNAPVTITAKASDMMIGGVPGQVTKVEFYEGTRMIGSVDTAPFTMQWTPTQSGGYDLKARAYDNENATSDSAVVRYTVLEGTGVPVIRAMDPISGRAGMKVTVTGGNFVGVTEVAFNGSPADFSVVDAGTILCQVPITATTGKISVTNGYGVGLSVTDFVVTESAVRISQVYGGGGNTGAKYNRDYVELYNDGDVPVDLTGWSVQYAQASGVTWQVAPLSGVIQPKKYYLIGMTVTGGGESISVVDQVGGLSMNAVSGKVALLSRSTALTSQSPNGSPGVMDFVGYGIAGAYEGPGAAPSGDVLTAVSRKDDGAVDTNNNQADFIILPANPRSSVSPPPMAPEIQNVAIGYGEVGNYFTYQVIAANYPTSYRAQGLPAGLVIDGLTGMISGVPQVSGDYSILVSASNRTGEGTRAIEIKIYPVYSGEVLKIGYENMGLPKTVSASIAGHEFQNTQLTFSGTATIRKDEAQVSNGYVGASGGGHVFFDLSRTSTFEIAGVNTRGYEKIQLSFGLWKSTTSASNELKAEYSVDGVNWRALRYTRSSGVGTVNWERVTCIDYLPEAVNLRIRFTKLSTTNAVFRLDDVGLDGALTGGRIPSLLVSSIENRVNSTYGSASVQPATLVVSGEKLAPSGVVVTAPAGYEVSLNEGSGYASSIVIPVSNYTLGNTTVYLRLAAGTTVGTYAGNVVITSGPIASPRYVAVVSSDVRPKLVTVKPNDRQKAYGTSLTLGSLTSGFTVTGMVGTDRISRVTLAADGGLAADAAVGTYTITASDASGGQYDPMNYDISYEVGTLTVTGTTYDSWKSQYPGIGTGDMSADVDGDGMSNLIEYYRGLDPTKPELGVVTSTVVGGEIQYVYRRAKGLQGVSGTVEWSDSLVGGSWTSVGVTEQVQDMGSYELVTATIPTNGSAKRFVREKVQVVP